MISGEMKSREVTLCFHCGQDNSRLYGILHQPSHPSSYGLLIITGRPALRAGRHRLFVLLARDWAAAGIPVMRFDFRGTGDCEGEMGTLDDTSEDIASAVDAFISNMPGLQGVILWGLCGGAADSILYAPRDSRVIGIALVNPWSYDARVRGLATLRRYGSFCLEQIRRLARAAGISTRLRSAAAGPEAPGANRDDFVDGNVSAQLSNAAVDRAYDSYRVPNLSKRLAEKLEEFRGGILLILSGKDTGSQAFKHAAAVSLRWRRLLSTPRVETHELPESNHSLRRPEWRAQVAAWTIEWVQELSDRVPHL